MTSVSRRGFVKTVGAAAAASLNGCWRPPDERILPYVEQPPEIVPGVPTSYATASVLDGYATGLVAQTREGRPVKIEGNPLHPASLGATGPMEQALLMELYDAGRLTRPLRRGGGASPSDALDAFAPTSESDGSGLALLLEPTSSPLREALLDEVHARWPGVRVYFHSATTPSQAMTAYAETAGRPLLPRHEFAGAETVVALDADPVGCGTPWSLRHARDLAALRAPYGPDDPMSRLYVAEPAPSTLAPLADHPLPIRAGDIVHLAGALVRALGGATDGLPPLPERLGAAPVRAWVEAAARDLEARPGRGVVVVGEGQPPAAHLLVHEANRRIGAFGATVVLQPPALARADEVRGGLARLTDAIRAGVVRRLIVLGGDPAYTAPADVGFAEALAGLDSSLHLTLSVNATSMRARTVMPARHAFESWGDARAFDGTLTLAQPLVRPLHVSATGVDGLLLRLLGWGLTDHEALQALWGVGDADAASAGARGAAAPDVTPGRVARPDTASATPGAPARTAASERRRAAALAALGARGGARFTATAASTAAERQLWWEDALRQGVVPGSALPTVPPPEVDAGPLLNAVPVERDDVEIVLTPDPRIHDGRFGSNPWLQELPHPTTKLTWGNAAMLSPDHAQRLGVGPGDPISITMGDRTVEAPALPTPGHADGSVTITLGYGQAGAASGRFEPLGVNAYALRTSDTPRWAAAVVAATGGPRWPLAIAQTEMTQHDRPIALTRSLTEYREQGELAREHRGAQSTWYETPRPPGGPQWGMSIDLSRCTGCSACVVACRAENNIPVVGPADVRRGRIMDWLRLDAYVDGPARAPDGHVRQPMLCQHCEYAPCEYVCPVYATVHSSDGLNEMVYNRCVGTRFCSNNCPYKVRTFNWFDYAEQRAPPETLVLNPDVTVRGRGVMEKCTYCVQRIRRAQIEARKADRPLHRDEVVTACQQACPTRAIVFGDLTDSGSGVARLRESPRRYEVLHELGTRPRTQYLVRIRNPSPALTGRGPDGAGDDRPSP